MPATALNDFEVPVIDIAPYREGGPMAGKKVIDDIDQACREVGFLVIKGHGVDRQIVENAFRAGYDFFDLHDDEKRKISVATGRGYSAVGKQALARSRDEKTPPDLFERFSMGPVDFPDDDYHRARADSFFAPNRWPKSPSQFRQAFETYYRAVEKLAATLMQIFAHALDLPSDYFDDKIDKHISDLCINHYPPQSVAPLPGQLRAGAHTDYGSLTIVAPNDAPGGLQVRSKSGDWVDVPWVKDAFIINIGDLMAQWTNDRWVSTMHRVVNPPRREATDTRRMSIILFHQPNDDTVIQSIPTCVDRRDNPERYPATTSGEHLRMKVTKHLAVHDEM